MRAIIESALHALSRADLSDAMDRLGIAGQCAGIMPLDRSFRIVGEAWTLRYGEVHDAEDHIRAAVERGEDLRKARGDFGYHRL
jgi:hypothetical protein